MDDIIRRGLHRIFALQHLPLSREEILRLIDICHQELESRRLQEIGQAHQMELPPKGQTVWYRSMPDVDLLPNFLFWIDKGTCHSIHPEYINIVRGVYAPVRVAFDDLILDRPSYNRAVTNSISSYGTSNAYHQITAEGLEETNPSSLGWLVYHHGAGQDFESVGLIPAIARRSAPGTIPTSAPILSLEVALEVVWGIIASAWLKHNI